MVFTDAWLCRLKSGLNLAFGLLLTFSFLLKAQIVDLRRASIDIKGRAINNFSMVLALWLYRRGKIFSVFSVVGKLFLFSIAN